MTKKHKDIKKIQPKGKSLGMPPYLAILSVLGVWILFLYLIVNIYLSESLSPLYTKLTGGEFDATVAYLQKTKKIGIYDVEAAPFKEIYGRSIEQAVAIKDEEKKSEFARVEAELAANPKARDVLYRLYQLYSREGEVQKAREYLKRAQAVDPEITK